MLKKQYLTLIASAVILAGCGDEVSSEGESKVTVEQYLVDMQARSTTIDFTLQGGDAWVPPPSALLMNTQDATLKLPTGGDDTLSNPKAAMNEADGWSTIMPIALKFKGTSFTANATPVLVDTDTVRIFKLNGSLITTASPAPVAEFTDFTAVKVGDSVYITPTKSFDASSEYIFAITEKLTNAAGQPVGTSSSYATLKSANTNYTAGDLQSAQKVVKGVEKLYAAATAGFGGTQIAANEIVYSAWFTTASSGNVVGGAKNALASTITAQTSATPPELTTTPSMVWKGTANPNNLDAATINKMFEVSMPTTGVDFDTYINSTAISTTLNTAFGSGTTSSIGAVYDTFKAGTKLKVFSGTIKLPTFIETSLANDAWKKTSWRSGMPSIAKIKNVQQNGSDADKAAINAELDRLNITDLTNPQHQKLLVGEKLALANGVQLDPERVLTKYSTVPQLRSIETVPFTLIVPSSTTDVIPTGLPVALYQHGITSIKESMLLYAANYAGFSLANAQTPFALLAIDQPLHGQRALTDGTTTVVTTPSDPTPFMNLEYLTVARDNIRQSAIDSISVRFALNKLSLNSNSVWDSLDESKVSTIGHSIGAITGINSYVAANNGVPSTANSFFNMKSATFANGGGGIAPFLLASGSFGNTIKHSIIVKSVPKYSSHYVDTCAPVSTAGKDCYANYYDNVATDSIKNTIDTTLTAFTYAAQTVLSPVDPINVAALNTQPVFGIQANADTTIPATVANAPNAGTEALFKKLGLVTISNTVTASKVAAYYLESTTAGHSTFIGPKSDNSDKASTVEMQMQTVSFIQSEGASVTVTNAGLLDTTKNP